MPIRKLPDGSVEADTPEEMQAYLTTEPERDLRSIAHEDRTDSETGRRGYVTPLFCFLPIRSKNWILTPLACFYRPSVKR